MPLQATLSRQLTLGGFSESLETTRATDDAVLRAAIGRLFDISEFTDMTRATQEVLIALLARRDFKAPARIHPSAYSQEFIARAAGVSRSTVKRAYAVFEGLGWLIRGEQAYDERHKRYEGTPISFSPDLVERLGLVRTFDSAAKEIAPRAPASIFEPAASLDVSPVVQNEPLIDVDSLEQSSSKRQSPTAAKGQKPVPRELFCLIEKGLTCWTVFWLMKLAGKANKRLTDIVEAKRHAIEKRQGRMLVGFLQHLIRQDVDYAWQKKELDAVAQEQTAVARSERALDALSDKVVCVDGGGQPILIRRASNGFHGELVAGGGSIPHADLLKLARAGRLVPWKAPTDEPRTNDANESDQTQPAIREAAQNALSRIRSLVGIRGA